MTEQTTAQAPHPAAPTPHQSRLERIREEERKVRSAVGQQMTGYVVTALGLVAGLAWNGVITEAINDFFPATGSGLLAKVIYALVLTLFVGVAGYYITKFFKKEEDKK